MKKKYFIAVVLLIAVPLFSGCSALPPPNAQNTVQTPAAEKSIKLSGSVGALPLILALSEGFQSESGAEKVEAVASGEQAALDALAAREADLAMIDRNLSDTSAQPGAETVAYQAVAVIVNPSAGVRSLTHAQITSLFTGESDSWADYGGNGQLAIFVPEKSDSFRVLFEETFALRGPVNGIMKSLIPAAAKTSQDIVQDVKSTPGAIGICPAASLENMDDAVMIDEVKLSPDTLEDGAYPAGRKILLVLGEGAGDGAKSFFDYCVSGKAADIYHSAGFMPLK